MIPVPSELELITRAVVGWAKDVGEVSVMPLPRSCAAAPLACANESADVSVTPVPPAPAVPTAEIVRYSTFAKPASIATRSPTTMFVTEATLMFVSPTAAAAASVVAVR